MKCPVEGNLSFVIDRKLSKLKISEAGGKFPRGFF